MLMGSPQNYGATPTSLRGVELPARFARLSSRFAVIFIRESTAAATTAGASAAAIAARGALALGSRFVDFEAAASHFFSVESGNRLRCLSIIGHFHESKTARPACLAIRDHVNAPDLPKSLEQRLQIGLRGLKTHVPYKNAFHSPSPLLRSQN